MKTFLMSLCHGILIFGVCGVFAVGLIIIGSLVADGFLYTMKDRLSGTRCQNCGGEVHLNLSFFKP